MKTTASNTTICDESGKILDLDEVAEWAAVSPECVAALTEALALAKTSEDPMLDALHAGLALAYDIRQGAARLHRHMVEDAREFERWIFFVWKDGTWCRLQLVEVAQ